MSWIEDLPKQCPPKTAAPSNGIFYRLVDDVPPSIDDFWSNRVLFPEKVFPGVSECEVRACSVFNDYKYCNKQKKYSRLKHKKIVKFNMETDHGVVDKTRSEGHYSWWIKDKFNPRLVDFEEVYA
jgi:hypothetical protein